MDNYSPKQPITYEWWSATQNRWQGKRRVGTLRRLCHGGGEIILRNGWFYARIDERQPSGPDNRLGLYRKQGRRIYNTDGKEVDLNEERKKATAATVAE